MPAESIEVGLSVGLWVEGEGELRVKDGISVVIVDLLGANDARIKFQVNKLHLVDVKKEYFAHEYMCVHAVLRACMLQIQVYPYVYTTL